MKNTWKDEYPILAHFLWGAEKINITWRYDEQQADPMDRKCTVKAILEEISNFLESYSILTEINNDEELEVTLAQADKLMDLANIIEEYEDRKYPTEELSGLLVEASQFDDLDDTEE